VALAILIDRRHLRQDLVADGVRDVGFDLIEHLLELGNTLCLPCDGCLHTCHTTPDRQSARVQACDNEDADGGSMVDSG
jgi:hypothetical protein